jgi:hypothetical protein
MPRLGLGLALVIVLAACGSAAAPTNTIIPTVAPTTAPTAVPTARPTSAPLPTPDAVALGQQYLQIIAALNTAQCPGAAISDAAIATHPPDGTLSAWHQAGAIIKPALLAASNSLRTMESSPAMLPSLQTDVDALAMAWDRMAGDYYDITLSTSLSQVVTILDNRMPADAQAQHDAGTAIRTKLNLPPGAANPCG